CVNFGKPNQQALDTVNVAQMMRYMEEGHFPAGRLLPKIVASLAFLHQSLINNSQPPRPTLKSGLGAAG
ncbi:hypothetical protein ACVGV5_00225, partial [Enterobacter sichuanensis]